jgi:hypothetical protein
VEEEALETRGDALAARFLVRVALYSPNVVEGEFCELRLVRVLESSLDAQRTNVHNGREGKEGETRVSLVTRRFSKGVAHEEDGAPVSGYRGDGFGIGIRRFGGATRR